MPQTPFEQYLAYSAAIKMSKRTLEAYTRSLNLLGTFLAKRKKQLIEADARDIMDFVASQSEWSAATIANRLAAFRSFYRWAVSQKLIADAGFLSKIPKPKIHTKRNKPTVSLNEAETLRDTRRTKKNGTARVGDLRDRCLIALIFDTGIRVTEAVSLNVSHIQHMNPERREFVYTGKGGSECSWFVTEPIYELLISYLHTHPNPVPESPLFLNRYGERLSVRSVQKMLSTRGDEVLGKHLHPHMLRRGFGNAFYEASGHDIYLTSQAMHHSSIATTQGYLSVSSDKLKQVVDAGMGLRKQRGHALDQKKVSDS